MGLKNSGKRDERSAPYFRKYVSLSADVDLTEAVPNAKGATSGLIVSNPTAGALDVTFEGADGVEVTLEIPTNCIIDLPVAAVRLDEATEDLLNVLAYWHPRGGALG
jgi:hypothetical protein